MVVILSDEDVFEIVSEYFKINAKNGYVSFNDNRILEIDIPHIEMLKIIM